MIDYFPTLTQGADIDAFYLGDVLRALGCNCTNATVMANGGTERIGKYNVTKGTGKVVLLS